MKNMNLKIFPVKKIENESFRERKIEKEFLLIIHQIFRYRKIFFIFRMLDKHGAPYSK